VNPIVIELAVRPGGLECRVFDVLVFHTHLEAVFAVHFGEVVGQLSRLADFIRRQEGVRPERVQTADPERGQAAIFATLEGVQTRDIILRGYSELSGDGATTCR